MCVKVGVRGAGIGAPAVRAGSFAEELTVTHRG
jgi:hypothetical protein